jgi:hypothetical protein
MKEIVELMEEKVLVVEKDLQRTGVTVLVDPLIRLVSYLFILFFDYILIETIGS